MDGSWNIDSDLSVVTGSDRQSFMENDSFFARAPPLAASTVGRTKSRRPMITEPDLGSFLEDQANTSDQEQDSASSLGILNVDEMDLSSNNILDSDSPRDAMLMRNIERDLAKFAGLEELGNNLNSCHSTLQEQRSSNGSPWQHDGSSSLKEHGSDSNQWRHDGSSSLKEHGSGSNQWRHDGSSSLKEHGSDSNPFMLSNGSQDSKPDQPFARSQLGTVKKASSTQVKNNPIASAICQTLFAKAAAIGEENEDGDASVHHVEIGEDDLQELDADFEEINCSIGMDSDVEKSPEKTPTNSRALSGTGDEFQLDSVYLRPGTTGGEQSSNRLPYLSKVSLFDGGSGSEISEIDTEDELEMVRKAQGERREAAGEDSDTQARPGLEGLSLTEETSRQLPIYQRQSAEGDVVASPVPGDGGGGGDGSSGSDNEGRMTPGMMDYADRALANYHSSMTSQAPVASRDKQEPRIRPMGDDLLSDLRFGRYASSSSLPAEEDVRLSSRYLTPASPIDDMNSPSFNIDDFLASQNGHIDQDFDPGNRLEASGFNADDASAVSQGKELNGNPFDVKSSSFGSFGLSGPSKDADGSIFSGEIIQADWISTTSQDTDTPWGEMECSTGTSRGSKSSSLGQRSAASGSPRRSADRSAPSTARLSNTSSLASKDKGYVQTPRDWDFPPETPKEMSFTQTLKEKGSFMQVPKEQSFQKSAQQRDPFHTLKNQGLQRKSAEKGDLPRGIPLSNLSGLPQPDKGSKGDFSDAQLFRKPTLPAPKAANFSKSAAKSKSSLHGSSSESSIKSKPTSSAKSNQSEYYDLEFKTSLTEEANEQREGLKRVPSIGGTSQMDLTVNDDEFFGNADGLAMLDEDEANFQADNIFIKDDAMADTNKTLEDSWAYRSIMSVARPSWLEGPEDEEEVCVRISVGTFMRGRTEALGSLSGDAGKPRPDFGMEFSSPPRHNQRPACLLEQDEDDYERTSGVGAYGANDKTPVQSTPVRKFSEKEADNTLTMDSLLKTPQPDSTLTVSTLDFSELGIKQAPGVSDSTKLSMGEISLLLKAGDKKTGESKINLFHNMLSSKSKSKTAANSNPPSSSISPSALSSGISTSKVGNVPSSFSSVSSSGVTGSISSLNSSGAKTSMQFDRPRVNKSSYSASGGVNSSPTKMSHLPVRQGSSLTRSFPKVADPDIAVSKRDTLQRIDTTDSGENARKSNESQNRSQNDSLRASNQSMSGENSWSSPNTSNFCPSASGLIEKMDNFNFAGVTDSDKLTKNLTQELKEKFRITTPFKSDAGQKESLKYDNIAQNKRGDKQSDRDLFTDVRKLGQIDGSASDTKCKFVDKNTSDRGALFRSDQSDTQENRPVNLRSSPVHDKRLLDSDMERSRLDSSALDHGYMPGHHIPDGTEYSQRSDYAHIGHRGELREDVAGLDDVGLVESRGFDVLKGEESGANNQTATVKNSGANYYGDINKTGSKDINSGDKNMNMNLRNSRLPMNFQPMQSTSPVIKHTGSSSVGTGSHVTRTQTVTQAEGQNGAGDTTAAETQSGASTEKMESWTQTSTVLKERVSPDMLNGENNIPVIQTAPRSDRNEMDRDKNLNVTGIPPKLPVTSFKHNLLPNKQSAVPEKPHLLTNKSLLQTDFAQGNLRRDFSVEVMDRIYSRNSTLSRDTSHFQTLNATNATHAAESYYRPHGRESLESNVEWQYLQGRESIDTLGGDFPRISDIFNGNPDYSSFRQFASLQSTPYPHRDMSETSWIGQTPVSSGPYSLSEGTLQKYHNTSSAPAKLCPVEAPGVLKFQEVQCVGISRKEILPLKNPTDTWMECVIQVKSLERDGKPFAIDSCPFTLRKSKVIIDPHKTESIDVIFIPKWSGAYVAHLQLYSHSFVKKDDMVRDSICVNVTLQAIAEDPHIEVFEKSDDLGEKKGLVNFGEVVWGTCRERTICIRNIGLATLPLRLAITSNKGWHCFAFEPEGRESDVSVISGRQQPSGNQGRSIINLSLSGSNQPFNYHEVKIWCRPPDKHYTKAMSRQPPELFRCNVDVEVDVPSCKFPVLSSLQLSATVGVQKLHIQSNLTQIHLTAAPNKAQDSKVKVFNAGNLNINVAFGFSAHKDLFSVSPDTLILQPGVDAELTVAFKPTESSTKTYQTLLLMLIKPDGPMFELAILGEVKQSMGRKPKFLCDQTKMDFGGVPIGKTCVKRFRLISKDTERTTMKAVVRGDNILLSKIADPNTSGSKSLELHLLPEEIVPVYVLYSPTSRSEAHGKVVMRFTCDESLKFSVHINGYGGVSKLSCSEEGMVSPSIRGFPCVSIQSFSLSKVKEVIINNQGLRAAQVKVAAFRDLECTERMTTGLIIVQPSEFLIDAHQQQKLEIVLSMTEREFQGQVDMKGVGAVLCLEYKDIFESAKPYRSKLVVGLIKGLPPSALVDEVTSTPSKSTKAVYPSPRHMAEPRYDTYNHLTDRSDTSSARSDIVRADNSGGWCIKPQHLVLYCSRNGPSEELDKFSICNNNNRDIEFEIVWPGKMLSLTPADGTVKARENVHVRIFPASSVSQCLDKLPWSGTVMVTVDGVMKSLKVDIRPDHSAINIQPELDDRSLVPISTNIPLTQTGTSRLGNLQVSRTVIQFSSTITGKTAEEVLELSNLGSETIRWMFSSFASPYLKKKSDGSKELFRVSYKVFDFSHQFGKLDGKASAQLILQFMPRSTGTFSQYWDLQTSGNTKVDTTAKQDYIRLHLTGEGLDETERKGRSVTDVENLLPRLDNTKLRLSPSVMEFSPVKQFAAVTMKVEMRNGHLEDIQVEVTVPKPPFYMKYSSFKCTKKRYIRVPVEFRPSRTGSFQDVVKFQASTGESLILKLTGECA